MPPKNTKYVAYYRVSTKKQGQSGLGLEAQQASVRSFIQTNAGSITDEYTEVESGKRDNNRPKLHEALKRCRLTNSVLIVAKLDRLSRNAKFLLTLRDSQVKFICVDMPEANNLTIGLLAIVAEHERDMISQRTKDALKAAKARGVKLGNPAGTGGGTKRSARIASNANVDAAKARANDLREVVTDARGKGYTTLQSIADHLNGLGIGTPRGGQWYPTSVKNLLSYIEA